VKSKTIRVLTLLAAAPSFSTAQNLTDRIRDNNFNSWWVYAGDHPVKGPWGIYAEVQIRRSDFASIWQQFQSRDAVTYRFSPHVQGAIGYVFTYTGRYGDFPQAALGPFNEHRTYQQLIFKHEVKKLELEHRYRNEQRWIQNFTSGGDYFWRYQNRFRYQFKAVLPISGADAVGHQWYLFGGDEILLPYGPNHGPNSFDQNRAFVGIGYKVTRNNKLEIGYLNQFQIQRNNRIEENNHTFRLQWSSSTPVTQLLHF
jgi:hypothetical protein